MNLNHLHYFRVLAKVEHYTQASAELSITQPSLSHAISSLEKELETYLFEKHERNVRLTKYGKFFYKYVDSALSELELGEKKLRSLTSDSAGTIDFIPIMKQELVLIVSPEHPLASKDSIDLKDTAEYPFVYFNNESGIRPVIDNLFSQINITPKIACEVEEDTSVAGLVAINFGIAIVPNIPALDSFNVKILPITNPLYERFIYLASIKNAYLPPSVNKFKKFVIDNSSLNVDETN